MSFTIDFEVTNRCNADCYFCPRDQTPHEGLMTPEVFDQSLRRAVEYREAVSETAPGEITVSLCGLGEPLVSKHVPAWVAAVKAEGFRTGLSSNGALLDERRGSAVLEGGLDQIMVNAGEIGDDYEDIYKLPWERTRDNIERFIDMAGDDCIVSIVLVNHRGDMAHVDEVREFWRERGVTNFVDYEIINRGGALFVDTMQHEATREHGEAQELLAHFGGRPLCGAPFAYLFVGYDGLYYLCCSDWKKQVPLGSVFDKSFLELVRPKLEIVSRRDSICRSCNIDPVNQLTDALLDSDESEARRLAESIGSGSRDIERVLESMIPGVTSGLPDAVADDRKLIPVRAD